MTSALSWWLQLDLCVLSHEQTFWSLSSQTCWGCGVFLPLRMTLDDRQHPAHLRCFQKIAELYFFFLVVFVCLFSVRGSSQQQGFPWVLATKAKPLSSRALPMLQPCFYELPPWCKRTLKWEAWTGSTLASGPCRTVGPLHSHTESQAYMASVAVR